MNGGFGQPCLCISWAVAQHLIEQGQCAGKIMIALQDHRPQQVDVRLICRGGPGCHRSLGAAEETRIAQGTAAIQIAGSDIKSELEVIRGQRPIPGAVPAMRGPHCHRHWEGIPQSYCPTQARRGRPRRPVTKRADMAAPMTIRRSVNPASRSLCAAMLPSPIRLRFD